MERLPADLTLAERKRELVTYFDRLSALFNEANTALGKANVPSDVESAHGEIILSNTEALAVLEKWRKSAAALPTTDPTAWATWAENVEARAARLRLGSHHRPTDGAGRKPAPFVVREADTIAHGWQGPS